MILFHDHIAHVMILVFHRPVTTDGQLVGCGAHDSGADPPRRLTAAIPAASAVSAFNRSRDTHDLLYQRLPVSFQPIRRHAVGTHGTRLDATVALVVLHVAFCRRAVAGKVLTSGKQGWLVALDLHQHVGLLLQGER
jgi:hypothetical protein